MMTTSKLVVILTYYNHYFSQVSISSNEESELVHNLMHFEIKIS
jgi:hypothetical protein